jgi:folate-binding protein YgfZ
MSEVRVAPGSHDLVWVTGSDAVTFVDGQLSQDVGAMGPGTVLRSLILEPRGKLRGIVWVLRGVDDVGLLTWAGTGAGVAADLERFRFRVDAAITVHERFADSIWETPPRGSGTWIGGREALRVELPAGCAPARIETGGAAEAMSRLSAADLSRERVLAGEPVFGVDVDGDTIPQETGLVAEAVSFTKGCFLGQELVARIDSRGHVNRMLRRLAMSGGDPPAGAEVVYSGDVIGRLGTVAAVADGVAALAVVRREAEPGASVAVRWDGGEVPGRVEEILRGPLISG